MSYTNFIILTDAEIEQAAEILADRNRLFSRIPCGDLQTDFEHYQRALSPHKISRYVHGWNPLGLGALIVSRRVNEDGSYSYWICDGSHRNSATLQVKGRRYEMDCLVYTDLTMREEAMVFAFLNLDRGPVPTARKYFALWRAGNADVCGIVSMLEELSIHASDSEVENSRGCYSFEGSTNERTVVCWAALHDIWRKGGGPHLRAVLSLVLDCWDFDRTAITMKFLKGISILLRNHGEGKDPNFSIKRAISVFHRINAETIASDAETRRSGSRKENERPSAQRTIYLELAGIYNRGRRGENRLRGFENPKDE